MSVDGRSPTLKKRVLESRLGPKLRGIRNYLARGTSSQKVVSVVVPVYNVEDYLAECVASILSQSHANLEVLLIDDGSTDSSRVVAKSIADKDSRVRVLQHENRGPGATRNRGISEATGEFIMFVDADDILPPKSLERLFVAAEKGRADFSLGRYQRFRGDELIPVRQWMKDATPYTALGIAPSDCPEVVATITSPTKLFRRSFLLENALRYPEGVFTEDQLFAAHAYCAANRISILPVVVYLYRQRQELSSTTDSKSQLGFLTDICEQTRLTVDYYRDHAPVLFKPYREYLLGVVYPSTLRKLPGEGLAQQELMSETCAYVMGLGTEGDLAETSSIGRVFVSLAIQGRWDLVGEFEDFLEQHTVIPPMHAVAGKLLIDFRGSPELQAEVRDSWAQRSEFESRLLGAITEVSLEESSLQVEFFAVIRGLSMPVPTGEIEVELASSGGDVLAPVVSILRVDHSDIPNQVRNHANANYAGSLVRASFDVDRIPTDLLAKPDRMRVRVTLTQDGIVRSGVLQAPRPYATL